MSSPRWYFDPVECRVVDTTVEPVRQWISTRDALEHLLSVGLSRNDNTQRLAQWAAAGLLPARALFLRERNERSDGSLVPTWVWEQVVEGLWVRNLDWQAGSIRVLRYNMGPILDFEAHGIEFDKASLLRLAPGLAKSDVESPSAADQRIGRPISTGRYSASDEVILTRIQEMMDQGCSSPTEAARQLWVQKELAGAAEESAIRRVVRKFRKRATGPLLSLTIPYCPLNSPDCAPVSCCSDAFAGDLAGGRSGYGPDCSIGG